MTDLNMILQEAADHGLTLTDGGFRVKETPWGYVDVVPMIYNWRVCRIPLNDPFSYDRGWCYAGTGPASFAAAVLAARAWDGGDDTEPAGWNKNVQTGEWRAPGGEQG
jgi:hypothetical protein